MQKQKGKVKWFNDVKGYGFITTENGEDIFVHYSDIGGADFKGYRTLDAGQEVEFEIAEHEKGKKAVNVIKLNTEKGIGSLQKGKVKWYNTKKGYGFITTEAGEDIFFHVTDIVDETIKTPEKDQEVEFVVVYGRKGKKAVGVTIPLKIV